MYLFNAIWFFVLHGICMARPSETLTLTSQEMAPAETPYDPYSDFKNRVLPKVPENTRLKEVIDLDGGHRLLTKWLQEKNDDVYMAEKDFLNYLKARKNYLDTIETTDKEAFGNAPVDLPVFYDTFGRNGQPVLEIWFSSFPSEAYYWAGRKRVKFHAYMAYFLEMNERRLFEQLKKMAENGTTAPPRGSIMILELSNFTARPTCSTCENEEATLVQDMFRRMWTFYPGSYEMVCLLNRQGDEILRRLRKRTGWTRTMPVYTEEDRDRWIEGLDRWVDRDQRSERFGGTIVRDETKFLNKTENHPLFYRYKGDKE